MLESRRARVGVVGILLGILLGLIVWHGTLSPAPAMGAYPGTEEIATGADSYVGERVTVGGRVVTTDPVVIAAPYDVNRVFRIRIVGLDSSVDVSTGSGLTVHGVLRTDGTVRSVNAVVYTNSGLWYTWSVSFLAGLWVLGRIVKYWGLNPATWALERRDRPVEFGELAQAWLPGDRDA